MFLKSLNFKPTGVIFTLLAIILLDVSAFAQKVAEGEYAIEASHGKAATHWILYRDSEGFRLESEIQNLPSAIRVIQTEELNASLVPSAIGYKLFDADSSTPAISSRCDFFGGTITCHGHSNSNSQTTSRPYKYEGNVLLFFEGLSALDFPWLIDGAVTRALAKKGGTELTSITVSGGVVDILSNTVEKAKLQAVTNHDITVISPGEGHLREWDFSAEKESSLEFVGAEKVIMSFGKISAKHYVLKGSDEPMNVWVADSGILLKINDVVLINYKQYVKLIPEVEVEDSDHSAILKR